MPLNPWKNRASSELLYLIIRLKKRNNVARNEGFCILFRRLYSHVGSDHCAVKLFIQSDSLNKKARPGFWKFNSPLLEDESYITELKENIIIYRNKYQCIEDKGLKWDLMKMEMRGFTIAFAKRKAENKRDEEKKLQAQLNELLS